jgi:multimeric flavodoxin WrbA
VIVGLFGRKNENGQPEKEDAVPLKAVFVNCSLKSGDTESHTDKLFNDGVAPHLAREAVSCNTIRLADMDVDATVSPGHDSDSWGAIFSEIKSADILLIGTPLWLGRESSIAAKLIERLYAHSGETNAQGQSLYYNKVGGVLVTGNEDGAKAASASLLYALQHLGYTVPPQADAYWVGEAGPGPSYGDDGAGQNNDFTKNNSRIMTYSLIHMARLLKFHPIPAEGTAREAA